jgi:hypothetical protein
MIKIDFEISYSLGRPGNEDFTAGIIKGIEDISDHFASV